MKYSPKQSDDKGQKLDREAAMPAWASSISAMAATNTRFNWAFFSP